MINQSAALLFALFRLALIRCDFNAVDICMALVAGTIHFELFSQELRTLVTSSDKPRDIGIVNIFSTNRNLTKTPLSALFN